MMGICASIVIKGTLHSVIVLGAWFQVVEVNPAWTSKLCVSPSGGFFEQIIVSRVLIALIDTFIVEGLFFFGLLLFLVFPTWYDAVIVQVWSVVWNFIILSPKSFDSTLIVFIIQPPQDEIVRQFYLLNHLRLWYRCGWFLLEGPLSCFFLFKFPPLSLALCFLKHPLSPILNDLAEVVVYEEEQKASSKANERQNIVVLFPLFFDRIPEH